MARSLCSATVITAALLLASGASFTRAQTDTPKQGGTSDTGEKEKQAPKPPEKPAEKPAKQAGQGTASAAEATSLKDRLTIRVGAAVLGIRGAASGSTIRRESQVAPKSIKQVDLLQFAATTGAAFKLEAEYQLPRRYYLAADALTSSPSSAPFTDERDIGNFNRRGNFNLATFKSDYNEDYIEWGLGGGRQVWPWKPRPNSRLHLDVQLQYRDSHASYSFQAGELVSNPFDPNAFFARRFDPFGREAANYSVDFKTLTAGVRLFVNLSKRFNLESTFAPVLLGKLDATADLGPHGIVFIHDQNSNHKDPVFHTPNCDSDDPLVSTPPCQGLVDGDLKNPSLKVHQKSREAHGFQLALNLDYRFNEMFALRVGYSREELRSVGGTEKRIFGNDAAAGCPGPPDPNNPPTFQGPPACPDETGKLDRVATYTQAFTVYGRFKWF